MTSDATTAAGAPTHPAPDAVRIERDSLGEVAVPRASRYGAQTARALNNFRIGSRRMPVDVIHSYGLLKWAAAEANLAGGRLDDSMGRAISKAALEVASGDHDEHFPISVWQTGSGTQTHMNVNEVIAHRASEILAASGSEIDVHPNDHVNLGQSSNDTFPTVMHLAVLSRTPALMDALEHLRHGCRDKSELWHEVVTIGRTHLQDAVPMTVGAQWHAYVTALGQQCVRLNGACAELLALSIGGTAVGTGLNAEPDMARHITTLLSEHTGLDLKVAEDLPMAMSMLDPLVHFSSALRGLAVTLLKIADDIRLLASGPRTAIHELVIPANEPGSSIMPGKVNPTQAEMLVMVCMQVMALDVAVGHAGSHGELQLNVMRPLVISNILESMEILTDAVMSFQDNCVAGLTLDRDRIDENVARSPMLITALAPVIGYDAAALIAKNSMERNITVREAALESGVDADLYDRLVDPIRMARAEE
jgi:fumarate hydratase, class II